MRGALLACALIGCGRVAFDPLGDGGGSTGGDGANSDSGGGAGLIGHWTCDDDPADGADDAVAGRTATCTPPGCPAAATGRRNGACRFDGSDDYLVVASPPAMTTNAFTVAFWIIIDPAAAAFDIIVKDRVLGRSFQYFSSTATIPVQFYVDLPMDTAGGVSCGSFNALDGVWYHTAATYDGGAIRFYIDGALQMSCSGPTTISFDDSPLIIGDDSGTQRMFGHLDDIRLYDRALTLTEINALAQ